MFIIAATSTLDMGRHVERTKLVGDVEDILAYVISHHEPSPVTVNIEQERDTAWRVRYYNQFSDLERGEQYYRTIAVCRLLYQDVMRGSNNALLRKYVPEIGDIDPHSVTKVRYDAEAEEYVIYHTSGEIRIYKGDIAYIYPLYCQIPDAAEYDVAYEGEDVFSYAIYNDTVHIPVY